MKAARRPARTAGTVAAALAAGLALAAAAAAPAANLVVNGGFEQADPAAPGRPLGWDLPDGLGVQWAPVPAGMDGAARGRAIRMDTRVSERAMEARWREKGLDTWHIPDAAGNAIADTYGLSFYSAPFPVSSGTTYRVRFRLRKERGGEGAKVWVRGYGELRGALRRLYETVVFCRGEGGKWLSFEQEFSPTKHRPAVTEMRVMLYAYYPPGVYWFDEVAVEPVPPAR